MKFTWILWGTFIIELLLLIFFKPIISDFEFVSIVAVSLHVILTMLVILGLNNKLQIVFIGAFFSRLGFMLWDIYAKSIYILPNSGTDAVGYSKAALSISEDISLLNEPIYGGLYTKIIGFLFYLVGPQPIIGQYINVLLGLSVIYLLYKILKLLEIKLKVIQITLFIAAIFPNSLILSGIFLREMLITFIVTVSLYYFLKWFKYGGIVNSTLSIIMLGLASAFHSGVIGIFIGYAFVFIFYKKKTERYQVDIRSFFAFIILIMISYLGVTQLNDILLVKYDNVDSVDDIYETANTRYGKSAYLIGMTINNPIEFITYTPIKTFYFLTVPLPMNWRGFMDIFTFLTDSMLYFGVIIYFFLNKRYFKNKNGLIIGLIIIIISVSLVFGIGVSNAGTAVRHRQKIIAIFLVFFAVMLDTKQKVVEKDKKNKKVLKIKKNIR